MPNSAVLGGKAALNEKTTEFNRLETTAPVSVITYLRNIDELTANHAVIEPVSGRFRRRCGSGSTDHPDLLDSE